MLNSTIGQILWRFPRRAPNWRLLLIFAWVSGAAATASAEPLEYAIGADVSFLAQAEQNGAVFKDNGEAKPGLQIFKDHGYNWVRLRLFHSPDRLPNDLEYTIALAKQAKKLGFKILLNYHYSDTWADPAEAVSPAGLGEEVARRARTGGVRVHARHDHRIPRCGRDAGHGADRQRSDQRHAVARRTAAARTGTISPICSRPAFAASTLARATRRAR